MTTTEDTLRHALIGYALDQLAANESLLDAVGYRPTTPEERAATSDSDSSDYHAAMARMDQWAAEDRLGPCEGE